MLNFKTVLLIILGTIVGTILLIVLGAFVIGNLAAYSAEKDEQRQAAERSMQADNLSQTDMVDTMECPYCGKTINATTKKCPWCDSSI